VKTLRALSQAMVGIFGDERQMIFCAALPISAFKGFSSCVLSSQQRN